MVVMVSKTKPAKGASVSFSSLTIKNIMDATSFVSNYVSISKQ